MKWWQNAVVYQIYPRSFQDSNGDGIGDIPGIIQRLDYLEELGIDAIWLSPVYQSPQDDNGYDISDYEDIDPDFGTMEDMEHFIEEAKKRNIRVVMDLVVNHTSDEHKWFVEAKKSRDSDYREYYVWRDPVEGKEPNGLTSAFSGSAWEFDEESGQYYLHLFSKKQPDLNWENEKVRHEVYKMMNFWLDKGIGGFRMDVIDLIGKIPDQAITANGPMLHDYLQEMNEASFGNYDVMTVGETWGATPEIAQLYSDPNREELSMVFQFEHILLDQEPHSKWALKKLNIVDLKRVLSKWQTELGDKGWNSLFWNNHDTPRIVSRWGNDTHYRVESAKAFAILLHMMKGTPYIYQGEEIGMTNTPITDIREADDIETRNYYNECLEKGEKPNDILKRINIKGRDNARRPMPWNESLYGGFTQGTPWLELNPQYKTINVKSNLEDPNSVFYTYKKLIALRKTYESIVWGEFELLLEDHPSVFAYKRIGTEENWIVAANLSTDRMTVNVCEETQPYEVVLSNYSREKLNLSKLSLEPFEAVVVRVDK
jgi:glucan 1,6-alpha-glucosidase